MHEVTTPVRNQSYDASVMAGQVFVSNNEVCPNFPHLIVWLSSDVTCLYYNSLVVLALNIE